MKWTQLQGSYRTWTIQVDFETYPSTGPQITISILSSHHSGILCIQNCTHNRSTTKNGGRSQSTSEHGSITSGLDPFDPWLTEPQSNKTTSNNGIGSLAHRLGGFVFCMRAHGRGMDYFIDITTNRITHFTIPLRDSIYNNQIDGSTSKRNKQTN